MNSLARKTQYDILTRDCWLKMLVGRCSTKRTCTRMAKTYDRIQLNATDKAVHAKLADAEAYRKKQKSHACPL